ncbi:MAG TPA: hypothetical protein VFT64_08555 [Rickettsiales bacterium]|nr:hypothetical protein [Rickettsiales bacterium]
MSRPRARHRKETWLSSLGRGTATASAAILLLLPAILTSSTPAVSSASSGVPAVDVTPHTTKPVLTGGDTILGLPNAAQKETPATTTFVGGVHVDFLPGPISDEKAEFAPGPGMMVSFQNVTGTKVDGGYVWARFVPGKNGTEHPAVDIFGDTANIVATPFNGTDGRLPGLSVTYKHADPDDYGFDVYFEKQGRYTYPVFTNLNLSAQGNCKVAGHTSTFRHSWGGGVQWNGFNRLTSAGSATAWYSTTSPEVEVYVGPASLQYAGFMSGKPFAWFGVPQSKNPIFVGFFGQQPVIVGAPEGGGATC